jgi:hypothetical protein
MVRACLVECKANKEGKEWVCDGLLCCARLTFFRPSDASLGVCVRKTLSRVLNKHQRSVCHKYDIFIIYFNTPLRSRGPHRSKDTHKNMLRQLGYGLARGLGGRVAAVAQSSTRSLSAQAQPEDDSDGEVMLWWYELLCNCSLRSARGAKTPTSYHDADMCL